MDTERLISLVSAGIAMGSIYALVALGFVVIYKATGVVNFAQGDFVTLSAYLAVWAVSQVHLGIVPGYLFAILVMSLVGALTERVVNAPLRGSSTHMIIIATLGVGLAIRAVVILWQGTRPVDLPTPTGLSTIGIGGAAIPVQNLLIVAVTAVTVAAMALLMGRTSFGRQLRALAADRTTAQLYGVRVGRMSMLAFGIGGMLAALAGVLVGPVASVSTTMGFTAMIYAFGAAIIGGFGSIYGAVLGGLILGVFEQLANGYLTPEFPGIFGFILMLIVIALYPRGLLKEDSSARF